MPTAAGHQTRVSYLWEDDSSGNPNFAGTPDDSDHKPFGSDATLSTLEGSNQASRVFNPNSREARDVIEQLFDGSWSVEFTLTNAWWIRAVVHNGISTSGSSAPYTHTSDGDIPYSMQIIVGNEDTTDERTLKGCVVTSATINAEVGGMVSVTLEGTYADESLDTSPGSLVAQPAINERPMTFAQASLDRDGSTLSLIQNAELSIENNADLIAELGSRVAQDYSPKVRAISLSYGDIREDSAELERMYGSSSSTAPENKVENSVSAVLDFDNGKTGADKNRLKFELSTVLPDSYGLSGAGDPESDLEGSLSEIPASVKAVTENSNSSAR